MLAQWSIALREARAILSHGNCDGRDRGFGLVPLLVPLCTAFWFFFVQSCAMWISGPSHSFCYCYSLPCRGVQDYALAREIGLKIRIEQSSGGSSPPPGTIFETC